MKQATKKLPEKMCMTRSFPTHQSQSWQSMVLSNSFETILQTLPDVEDEIIDISNDSVSDEDECDNNQQSNVKPALNN